MPLVLFASLVAFAAGLLLLGLAIGVSDPTRSWTSRRRQRFGQLVDVSVRPSSGITADEVEQVVSVVTSDLLPVRTHPPRPQARQQVARAAG